MNDFTKQELEHIYHFFYIATEDFHEPDSTYELRDKIQSMINNYCEHNNQTLIGDQIQCLLCLKCDNCMCICNCHLNEEGLE